MVSQNLSLLRKKYPHIYEKINSIDLTDQYKIVNLNSSYPTLKIEDASGKYYLHSKYNPKKEAEKFVLQNYDESKSIYMIYGTGFFYHVKYLLEIRDNIEIYILETNPYILKCALESIDISCILESKRAKIIFRDDVVDFSMEFSKILKNSDIELIIHKPSLRAMPQEFQEVKWSLEEYDMKVKTRRKFSSSMKENFMENVKMYDHGLDILFRKFNRKPAILVSAGPSLDKNKHLLKKLKNKALILCVSSAVRALDDIDVVPDIIIAIDPSENLYNKHLKDLIINVPIILLATGDKNIMRNYAGIKFITFQRGYKLSEEYCKEHHIKAIDVGGSVATAGLEVLINFGCNPIIFMGQDLAYTDFKTHCDKVIDRKVVRDLSKLRKIEGVNTEYVYTNAALYSFLRWIENKIREHKDLTFIDATEGGAKIQGTLVMPLEEIIKKKICDSTINVCKIILERINQYEGNE
ncbi:MAG: DUF115 domain-containing protein [Clostridia bacterium]|nr:DUF115 domain-containing protein [Clostridia bacterium]